MPQLLRRHRRGAEPVCRILSAASFGRKKRDQGEEPIKTRDSRLLLRYGADVMAVTDRTVPQGIHPLCERGLLSVQLCQGLSSPRPSSLSTSSGTEEFLWVKDLLSFEHKIDCPPDLLGDDRQSLGLSVAADQLVVVVLRRRVVLQKEDRRFAESPLQVSVTDLVVR